VESDAVVNEPLVSSSWHRVAGLRPSLVPGLRVVRQQVRDQVWHVLVEPASGRQLRLNPAAYALVARFDGQAPVEQVWQRQLLRQREDAPTQDEVLRLLSQLFRGGMVRFDTAPNLSLMFARRTEEGQQRRRGMMNPLMLRMPLANPARLLDRLAPLAQWLFRPAMLALWLVAALLALLAAGAHFTELQADAQRLSATPTSYFVAWLAYPLVKLLHELGHGLAVRRYGGQVHEAGVSLMFLMPAPYVDAGAANAFPSPRQRLVVSAAGIVIEVALACLALWVWLTVSPGLVRDTALTVALICSISTVLFNANPLMRFDGYYALCDALQLPNLGARSQAWWSRRWRAWIGAPVAGPAPLLARGEEKWLAAYAPASGLYRVLLLLGLVFWVGSHSWLLGWMGALALLAWLGRHAWRWANAQAAGGADPLARRKSLRAAGLIVGVVLVLLLVVPAPHQVVARGVVWPPEQAQLRAGAAGFVERLDLEQGSAVQAGQTLVVLQDPVLVASQERISSERTGLLAQQYGALLTQPVRAQELAEDLDRNAAEQARIEEQLAQLEVRAHLAGEVVWARPQDLPGSFVKRGAMLGHVLTGGPAHVRVALLEEDYLRTRGRVRSLEVRLADAPGTTYAGRLAEAAPGATLELPAPPLGDRFGGPIPLDPTDPNGVRTRVPVFVLDAEIPALQSSTIGGRAWVKLVLPPQPLGVQWLAQLRQLLIKQFNPTGQA
jgi:putative peptide zinc metalloprotease protein